MCSAILAIKTGFLKGRLASDNVRRLLHIISDTKKTGSPGGLLFLDAEKAFDRLEWRYLCPEKNLIWPQFY